MPQNLQRNNNLSISNVEQWKPPTDPISDWQPPTEPINKAPEPSMLSRAYDFVNRPIVSILSPEARQQGLEASLPTLNESPWSARLKGFVSGATEGAADYLSAAASPLSMGLEALTAGAVGARGAGLDKVASLLETPGKVASGGMLAHGGYQLLNAPDFAGKAAGFTEAAMGGAGLKHLMNERPKINPIIPREMAIPEPIGPKLLGPAPHGTPTFIAGDRGVAENRLYTRDTNDPYSVQVPHGGTITPGDLGERVKVSPEIAATYGLKPDFVTPGREADYNKTKQKAEHKDLEERIYKIAQEKFNMGKPLNELEQKILDRDSNKVSQIGENNDSKKSARSFASRMDSGDDTIRMEIGDREAILRNMIGQYAEHGGKVATKELLQNAIDATSDIKGGKVDISLNYHGVPSITIKDNGPGLPWKTIKNEYTTLAMSGKVGQNKIGEMGVGKTTYLLGAEGFEVDTITKEENGETWHYYFKGTPEEIIKGNLKVIKTKVANDLPTGTKVTIIEKNKDGLDHAKDYLETFAKYSNSPVPVTMKGNLWEGKPHMAQFEFDKKVTPRKVREGKLVQEGSSPGADYKMTVPKEAVWGDRDSVAVVINNRGMFQGVDTVYLGEENLPDHIVLEVQPTVPAQDSKLYPLTSPTRERLKGPFKQVVRDIINEKLVKEATQKRTANLQNVFDNLKPAKGNKFVLHDSGNRYMPEELARINNSRPMKEVANAMETILDELNSLLPYDQIAKTAKFGFLLGDAGSGGINIPDPTSTTDKKFAILMNPFSAIEKSSSPKEAAQRMVHIIAHEFTHNMVRSEGAGYTWALANTYTKLDLEHQLYAKQAILSALTNGKNSYVPEIQNLLRQHQEARGRPDTAKDLLSRQRDSEFIKEPTGQNRTSSRGGPNGKRATPEQVTSVVDKLGRAIAEAMPKRAEQENMYSMERARRIAKAESIVKPKADGELRNPGVAGFYKQKSVLKGELPKVDYSGLKLNQDDVDTLINTITTSERLLPWEKIRAKDGLMKILDGNQGVPQNNELDLLRQVFGKSFDKIIEMHGGLGGPLAKKIVMEVANAPKAIMASIDLSAPMRQGLPLIHKKEFWTALGPMVKSFASTENFEALQQSLHERPYYLLGKEAGLKLTEVGENPAYREEAYGSNIANLIPGVKRSEQAYVGFLNKLRADTFDALINDAKAQGLHPKDVMHEIARFVNTATGRGSLGRLDKVATELNTVFFSPRLIASRLTILNPNYYIKASPFVRREAIKSLLAIAGSGLTINSLLSLAGGKVNTTLSDDKGTSLLPNVGHGFSNMPTNADFMKSRFGHTRVDPYGGFQQYIVAAGRLLSGETSSSITGKVGKLGQGFNAQTRLGVIGNFFENKLSPAASLVDVILKGKDFEGNPTNVPAEIANRFKPMFLNDLYEIYKDDPSHLPLGMASAIGMGVQTYAPPPKKGMTLRVH